MPPCLGRGARGAVWSGPKNHSASLLYIKQITMSLPASARPADLDLLTGFLRRQSGGDALPVPHWVEPGLLPETARNLLAHDHGMTATLEAYWGESMRLSVLHAEEAAGLLRRHVLLSGGQSGMPAELGLIEIRLDALPAAAQFAVRQRKIPFGAILSACGVTFNSRPAGFLVLKADNAVAALLRIVAGDLVHGRATTLYDRDGRMLATAVELLSGHRPA